MNPSRVRQSLQRFEAALRARAGRMTQRERFLVAALGLILLSCAVVLPFLEAADARDRLIAARAQMSEAEALARRAETSRLSAADPASDGLASVSLRAPSLSLARIALEQQVADAAAQSELTLTSVNVSPGFESDGAAPMLRVSYAVNYNPGRFYNMLQLLLTADHAVFIDRMEVAGDAGLAAPSQMQGDAIVAPEAFSGPTSGQARVELLAPVLLGTPEEETAETPSS